MADELTLIVPAAVCVTEAKQLWKGEKEKTTSSSEVLISVQSLKGFAL